MTSDDFDTVIASIDADDARLAALDARLAGMQREVKVLGELLALAPQLASWEEVRAAA